VPTASRPSSAWTPTNSLALPAGFPATAARRREAVGGASEPNAFLGRVSTDARQACVVASRGVRACVAVRHRAHERTSNSRSPTTANRAAGYHIRSCVCPREVLSAAARTAIQAGGPPADGCSVDLERSWRRKGDHVLRFAPPRANRGDGSARTSRSAALELWWRSRRPAREPGKLFAVVDAERQTSGVGKVDWIEARTSSTAFRRRDGALATSASELGIASPAAGWTSPSSRHDERLLRPRSGRCWLCTEEFDVRKSARVSRRTHRERRARPPRRQHDGRSDNAVLFTGRRQSFPAGIREELLPGRAGVNPHDAVNDGDRVFFAVGRRHRRTDAAPHLPPGGGVRRGAGTSCAPRARQALER